MLEDYGLTSFIIKSRRAPHLCDTSNIGAFGIRPSKPVLEWLSESGLPYKVRTNSSGYMLDMKTEDGKMMFKLAWSGK